MRYAIFVHDPDGDSGLGLVVGPFRTAGAADEKVEQIRRVAGLYREPECIVLEVRPGDVSARAVIEEVGL